MFAHVYAICAKCVTINKSHELLHLELFLQMRRAAVSWSCDAVDVAVKLASSHFRLLSQNGFHQGIVDEDVLLLDQQKGDKIHVNA